MKQTQTIHRAAALVGLVVMISLLLAPFSALAASEVASCATTCCCCVNEAPDDGPAWTEESGCHCAPAPAGSIPVPVPATPAADGSARAVLHCITDQPAGLTTTAAARGYLPLPTLEISPHTPVALHRRINC